MNTLLSDIVKPDTAVPDGWMEQRGFTTEPPSGWIEHRRAHMNLLKCVAEHKAWLARLDPDSALAVYMAKEIARQEEQRNFVGLPGHRIPRFTRPPPYRWTERREEWVRTRGGKAHIPARLLAMLDCYPVFITR